jgi:hypothetical protein
MHRRSCTTSDLFVGDHFRTTDQYSEEHLWPDSGMVKEVSDHSSNVESGAAEAGGPHKLSVRGGLLA